MYFIILFYNALTKYTGQNIIFWGFIGRVTKQRLEHFLYVIYFFFKWTVFVN